MACKIINCSLSVSVRGSKIYITCLSSLLCCDRTSQWPLFGLSSYLSKFEDEPCNLIFRDKNILVVNVMIHSSFLLHSLAARLKVLAEQYEVREEVCWFMH